METRKGQGLHLVRAALRDSGAEVLQLASKAAQAEARARRTGKRVLGIFTGQKDSQRGDSLGRGGIKC